MPYLLAADLSHFWPTHSVSAHTGKHNTTQHTHTHTHTHTPAYSAGKRTKQLKTCTASRHYHPHTKFGDFCGYSRAKKLFVRNSGRAIYMCRRFQSEIVRARAFPRYKHLPNLSACDLRRSPTSASLLSLFRGNGVKAFETAAIEDDARSKTASDGALSHRLLRKWLARRWTGHLCRVLKPPSEKWTEKLLAI